MDAGRGFARLESSLTQITFADDTESLGVLRHFVGTHQGAVAAADALIVEVSDDPGSRIFVVGQDRASIQAGRIDAVMAGRGDVLQGLGALRVDKEADSSPGLLRFEAVEGVTRRDARLATGAEIEIDFEGVLLVRTGRGCWETFPVDAGQVGLRVRPGVPTAEILDRRESSLLPEETVDEGLEIPGGTVVR